MENIKISVITVCKNAQDCIEKTIRSVLNQEYKDVEYIILDGNSSDNTIDIINKYNKNNRIKFVSEEDLGLYYAMNKGIDLCSGSYVIYMNSGDCFFDNKVLKEINFDGKPDVIYGNVVRHYENNIVYEKYAGRYTLFPMILMGRMPSHQSILMKRELLKKYRFDESYRICADYDLLVRCIRAKKNIQYIDIFISCVECVNGISSQPDNIEEMRREDDRSFKIAYPILFKCFILPKLFFRRIKRYKRRREW